MLSFFRGLTKSKWGLALLFAFLGLIAFAFAASDLSMNMANTGGLSDEAVAEVGGAEIGSTDLSTRVQQQYDQARQANPELDIMGFVEQGGVEQTLQQIINGVALEAFGGSQGITTSRRLVDGEIASVPAFRGLSGEFDETIFRQLLQQRRISEAQLRADIRRDLIAEQMIVPVSGATAAPAQMTLPYASLLLEARQGRAATIPFAAIPAGPPPTDAQLTEFYKANVARYTVPERRVVRYALFGPERFETVTATDAEIAEAYKQNQAQYAARETRTLSQLVVPTEAAAKAIASRVAGGTSLAAAAQQAGLQVATLQNQTREAYAGATSPAIAQAAFGAAEGTVAAPVRSGLGWYVVHVDEVQTIPARPLAEVREEIASRVTAEKRAQALADFLAGIEDSIADGATFDEVVQARQLQAAATPALTAQGRNPDAPEAPVDPQAAAIVAPAFEAEPEDDPVVQEIGEGRYAMVKLDRIVQAAPRPLAQIREQVAADYVADRARRESRRIASEVAQKVGRGADLAQALAGAGVDAGPVRPIAARRQDIMNAGELIEPEVRMLFLMAEGSAKIVETPEGWAVVRLTEIQRGDASNRPDLLLGTRQELSRVFGQEYAQQFIAAVRAEVGVEQDRAAIEAVKRQLRGQ